MSFVHLHVHTEYSLLDGASRIRKLVSQAKALEMPAVAITDHGVMYGVIDFYKEAKKAGIKPIIGCEVYVAQRTRFDREPRLDESPFHLLLLAENQEGYRNLAKLVSLAFLEGFYYKPRVDKDLLRQYSKGLIACSACLAGEIPRALMQGQAAKARDLALEYQSIFGKGNFFLEVQQHGIEEQTRVNRQLVALSQELEIPLVATNDIHYVEQSEAAAQDVLLCIQTGKVQDEENRMRFPSQEFYLKSEAEMHLLFGEHPAALSNTVAIADRCQVDFQFGQLYLPDYQVPRGYDLKSYLRQLCLEGLENRYPQVTPEILQRLHFELGVIEKMDFPGYFLIVWDLVNYARQQGIMVGPGRGSAAGSLVAYALGITDLDPLRYDLLFERFLNPERVSMPDIDIDFCYERRGEVIEYLVQKYGTERVAQIITFGTMAAKAAVRDVGRVLNMPYGEVDKVSKLIPFEIGISIEKALEISQPLREAYEADPQVHRLIDLARQLEGMPRHASTHAAGVVISRDQLIDYLPVQKFTDGGVTTQFAKETVEEIGLLKMDILGLRTLTVLRDALENIRQNGKTVPELSDFPLDDAKTYAMLSAGEGTGVFQLESSGMKNILRSLKPERFEDIIALVALYRPGPLGSGMVEDFIQRKHGKIGTNYLHPDLQPILEETYGVILYQEQVMKIAGVLAGFSMGQADMLRRAMGKKKPAAIAAMRRDFVDGAAGRGVAEGTAGQVFDLMEYFAGYGFNKSHSAAYALVAYQTAFLKANYPVEYMAALLTSVMDSADRVPFYLEECRRLNIPILPPDINESRLNFTVLGGQIRFGLAAVKNVGRTAIDQIVAAREGEGRFLSLADFCCRLPLNRRMLESLIRCGACDSLGHKRSQMLAGMDSCLDLGARKLQEALSGQTTLFDFGLAARDEGNSALTLPEMAEFTPQERLAMEKEIIGFYVSGHPLTAYEELLRGEKITPMAEITLADDNKAVRVAGIVTGLKQTVTKKGELMAQFTLEDFTGSLSCLMFPRSFAQHREALAVDRVLVAEGRVNCQEEAIKLFCDKVRQPGTSAQPAAAPARRNCGDALHPDAPAQPGDTGQPAENNGVRETGRLFVRLDSEAASGPREEVLRLLRHHPGRVPVCLYFTDSKKYLPLSKNFSVTPAEKLLDALAQAWGRENVILK